ncbi:MAG: hypothetical protein ACOYJ1_10425 [Peptococcales bacterium]|jgi:succinate dehydrogenase/fumarate reductase flavoprotein subunit
MQHLTGAFVYGKIAGESAVRYICNERSSEDNKYIESQFEDEFSRLGNLQNKTAENIISHTTFEYKVRRIINEYLLSPKNSTSLEKGLNLICELREKLPYLVRSQNLHELSKILEIGYILDCAQMSAISSLTRKESRWGSIHRRTDYPDTDNVNWLKHIDLQIGDSYPQINVSLREIQKGAIG